MYFYMIDDKEHKLYVSFTAGKRITTREDLEYYYNVHCEKCREYVTFSRNDIIAEQTNSKYSAIIFIAFVGFMTCLLFGSFGIIVGLIAGSIMVRYVMPSEAHDVEIFNDSG